MENTLAMMCTHHGVRRSVVVFTAIFIVALLAGPNKEFFASDALPDISIIRFGAQGYIPYGHSRNSHVAHR